MPRIFDNIDQDLLPALARVFENDHGLETLILCPRNLVPMWEDYRDGTGCAPASCR